MSGKRYIVLTRLEAGTHCTIHYEPSTARHVARSCVANHGCAADMVSVVEVDIDNQIDVTRGDPTDHERYEFAERDLLRATQEEARLRPALRGEPVLPAQDLSELREAAGEWATWCGQLAYGGGSSADRKLMAVLAKIFPDLAKRAA